MAETQLAGDELSENIARMSKNQLYLIMSQMKALIEQNQIQARHILVTNPPLTRALFQAQIMLGMVQGQPAEAIPSIPQTSQNSQQSLKSSQQSDVQASSTIAGQVGVQDQRSATEAMDPPNKQQIKQNMMPVSSSSIPSLSVQFHSQPSHPLQSWQQPMKQLQTPLQPQQRSPFIPAFGHQTHPQMGASEGLQNSGAPQMHQARPMFHSGHQHPVTVGPVFPRGHPSTIHQPTPYQGGSPHIRMEINQVQGDRGSLWITGLRDTTGTQLLPGPPHYGGGEIGPGSHPTRTQSLSPGMETALLQQVMSLTPEQINLLPAEQRNQVLQLRMMLRQ